MTGPPITSLTTTVSKSCEDVNHAAPCSSIALSPPLLPLVHPLPCFPPPPSAALDIGFDQLVYSVNEGAVLVLNVSIHSDTVLARPVTVSLDTIDGSAAAGNGWC